MLGGVAKGFVKQIDDRYHDFQSEIKTLIHNLKEFNLIIETEANDMIRKEQENKKVIFQKFIKL